MIDLGIFQGGSVAFFATLALPEKLVAIELEPAPVEAGSFDLSRCCNEESRRLGRYL